MCAQRLHWTGGGLEGHDNGLLVHDRAGRLTQHGVREIHDACLGDPGDPARLVEGAGNVRVFRSNPGEDLPGLGCDANVVPMRLKMAERSLGIDGLRGSSLRVRKNTLELDGLAHRSHGRYGRRCSTHPLWGVPSAAETGAGLGAAGASFLPIFFGLLGCAIPSRAIAACCVQNATVRGVIPMGATVAVPPS